MSMFLTWLPDVLRAEGLKVDVLPGWSQRGSRGAGLTKVNGIVCHHTVTGRNWPDHRVDHLLRDGHSTLAGPLSQLGLRRDGSFVVVAAGLCNHNGYGLWKNQAIGIEAYNDGKGEPWPDVQMDAYARGCAAICRHLGLGVDQVKGHKETDPNRKTDPTFDMGAFRRRVAALITEDPDDMTPELKEHLDRLEMRLIAVQEITARTEAGVGGLSTKATELRDSLASLVRRVLGVKAVADNVKQHRLDEATGAAIQRALPKD